MKAVEFRPNPGVGLVWRQVDDELVIVRPVDGQLVVLNGVGAFIWQAMDGNRTIAELADLVCVAYQVTHEQAVADVRAFVRQLESEGWLMESAKL